MEIFSVMRNQDGEGKRGMMEGTYFMWRTFHIPRRDDCPSYIMERVIRDSTTDLMV